MPYGTTFVSLVTMPHQVSIGCRGERGYTGGNIDPMGLTMRTILASSFALVLSAAFMGCVVEDQFVDVVDPPDPTDPTDPTDPGGPDPVDNRPVYQSCVDGAVPVDLPTEDWRHSIATPLTVAIGDPWHSAQDLVVADGSPVVIGGKFSYGFISKDLEDERVEVWIDDCAGAYRLLGDGLTNSDGRVALSLSAPEVPAVGEYGLYFRVAGDNSTARAILRVYPIDTRFIVFDIDATLTTSDSSLIGQSVSEILGGDMIPEPRPGAREIVDLRFAQHGYEILYLTGRPYLLDGITRDWLIDLGFPGGTVHLTDDVANSWPSDSQVGAYKADFLYSIIDAGFIVEAAYGNATSDIYAYEQADIAKDRTYILGENGGTADTVALGEGYLEHIEVIRDEPATTQPFRR